MSEAKKLALKDQAEAMARAKTALEAYWAGSATASFIHSVKRGDVVVIKADKA